jgi:hypothetical protein
VSAGHEDLSGFSDSTALRIFVYAMTCTADLLDREGFSPESSACIRKKALELSSNKKRPGCRPGRKTSTSRIQYINNYECLPDIGKEKFARLSREQLEENHNDHAGEGHIASAPAREFRGAVR